MRSERVDVRFERVEFWLKLSLENRTTQKLILQHQNDSMKKELQTLRNEFSRLQESLRSHEGEASNLMAAKVNLDQIPKLPRRYSSLVISTTT